MNLENLIIEQCYELERYINECIESIKTEFEVQYRNNTNTSRIMPENIGFYKKLTNKLKQQINSFSNQAELVPELVAEFCSKLLSYVACISALKTNILKRQKINEAFMVINEECQRVKHELLECRESIFNYEIEYTTSKLFENEKLASILQGKTIKYLDLINSDYFSDDIMLNNEFYKFIKNQPDVFLKLQHKEHYISQLKIRKSFLLYKKNKIYIFKDRLFKLKNSIYNEMRKLIEMKKDLFIELTYLIYNNNSYLFMKMLYGIIDTPSGQVYAKDVKMWLKNLGKNRY